MAVSLGGCGSIAEKFSHTVADTPMVGLPAGTPERPATQAAYPAVHDMPPARPAALTSAEQMKMEDDLIAARNHQQTLAGQPVSPQPTGYPAAPAYAPPQAPAVAPALAPAAKKREPVRTTEPPTSSSRTIY